MKLDWDVSNVGANETQLLEKAVEKTQSELIIFFVILVVAMIVVFLPLYSLVIKDKRQKNTLESNRDNKFIEREKLIIQVITSNTEVMAGLKATLESSGVSTSAAIRLIHKKMSEIDEKINDLSVASTKTTTQIDRMLNNQSKIEDTVDRTLLIVDSFAKKSNLNKDSQD